MDELLRIFISWQFIVLCLGIASITFVIRKIFEFIILSNPQLPGSKNSALWRSLILPILPIIIGGIAAFFANTYPYPEGLGASEFGRVCFGLAAGALSTTLYRVILELIKSKIANVVSYDESDHLDMPHNQTVTTTSTSTQVTTSENQSSNTEFTPTVASLDNIAVVPVVNNEAIPPIVTTMPGVQVVTTVSATTPEEEQKDSE